MTSKVDFKPIFVSNALDIKHLVRYTAKKKSVHYNDIMYVV